MKLKGRSAPEKVTRSSDEKDDLGRVVGSMSQAQGTVTKALAWEGTCHVEETEGVQGAEHSARGGNEVREPDMSHAVPWRHLDFIIIAVGHHRWMVSRF